MTRPFSDLLVIDFTHVLAGPACSYFLGLLGARVIKVESDKKGDGIRYRGGTDKEGAAIGMSTAYLTQASGKEAIAVDLESERGRDIMQQLLAKADVFVENHLPETVKHLNLDEKTISKKHPHLVHCSMTGYGRNGPQENVQAYDVNIQAACGLMELTGTAESGPTRTGAPILDYGTALAAGFAISTALYDREKTGKGCFIDVSMQETGLTLMSSTITDFLKTKNVPLRRGNLANSRSPGSGSFPCKTGMISLGVNEERHFHNLAEALSRQDWLKDERFSSRPKRLAYVDEFVLELESELVKYDVDEIEIMLQTGGVPAARIRTLEECLSSEQVQKRSFIYTCPYTGLKVPTLPFKFSRDDSPLHLRSAPEHGRDTSVILEWLEEHEM